MCEKEHQPWPMIVGNPCYLCNPPRTLQQRDIRRYCQPNLEPTALLSKEEDGHQQDIDLAIAQLNEVEDTSAELPDEEKAARQLFNQDPLDITLTAAPVTEEESNKTEETDAQDLIKEINDQRRIEENIEQLQMERIQELETSVQDQDFTKRVLRNTKVPSRHEDHPYGEGPIPLNVQFREWLTNLQWSDEALRLIRKDMEQKNQGKPVKERGTSDINSNILGFYKINHGEQTKNPNKIRKRRERVKLQVNNYRCFRKLFDNRWLHSRPGEPIMLKNGIAIIPLDAQTEVIASCHHGSGTFHLGIQRTYQVLKKLVYFPRMVQVISQYISNCHQCIVGKRLKVKTSPGMGKTSTWPHKPLQCWSLDLIHMPNSTGGTRGYKYILCMVDLATRWVEAFPIINATAQAITKILTEEIMPRYGEGLVYVTDQGREFMNKTVIEAIERSGGKHYPTTSYHSKSNPVERFNRTLEEVLRVKLLDKGWNKSMCSKCIPEVLYTMRCSPDTILGGVSPYRRVFTRDPYTRITTWIGNPYQRRPDQEVENLDIDDAIGEHQPENEILEETKESVTMTRKEQVAKDSSKTPSRTHVCTYQKVASEDGKTHYLQEVACIQMHTDLEKLIDDRHQAMDLDLEIREQASDELWGSTHTASARRHDDNASTYAEKRPVYYVPIVDELVDISRPTDPNSMDNRKLKMSWFGPYRVISVAPHGKTCTVEQLTLPDLKKANQPPRRIACEDVKPCTTYRMTLRPRGEKYRPIWLSGSEEDEEIEVLEVDGNSELTQMKLRKAAKEEKKSKPTDDKASTDHE